MQELEDEELELEDEELKLELELELELLKLEELLELLDKLLDEDEFELDEEELEPIKYLGIFHPYFWNSQHKCIGFQFLSFCDRFLNMIFNSLFYNKNFQTKGQVLDITQQCCSSFFSCQSSFAFRGK